jgi:hypothetical protein
MLTVGLPVLSNAFRGKLLVETPAAQRVPPREEQAKNLINFSFPGPALET